MINGVHTIHIKMKNKHNATNSIFHELYKNTKMDVKEDYVCLLVEKGVFCKMCIVLPEVINFIVIKKANA